MRRDCIHYRTRDCQPIKVIAFLALALSCASTSHRAPVSTELPGSAANLTIGPRDRAIAELTRMLFDRTEMKQYISRDDALWNWAVRSFEGTSHGFPIHWDAEWPGDGVLANHTCPRERVPAKIRLRPIDGSPRGWETFEMLWSHFVFEVENLRTAGEYDELCRVAVRDAMSREEWVTCNTLLEYQALEKTRTFYFDLWIPWCTSVGQTPSPACWYVGYDRTYEEWRERDMRRPDSACLLGSRFYDEWVIPQLEGRGGRIPASD